MNHKNYALREMLVDKCLQNGRAMTGREIMDFVNRYLEENGFEIIQSRTTLMNTFDSMQANHRVIINKERRGNQWYYWYAGADTSIFKSDVSADDYVRLRKLQMEQNGAGIDFLLPLQRAIENKQPVWLDYHKFNYDHSLGRIVHPYRVKRFHGRWYLLAWNTHGEHLSVFGMDRIVKMRVADGVSYREPESQVKTYFDDMVGVTRRPGDERVEVRLRVENDLVPYLRSRKIHHSQQFRPMAPQYTEVRLYLIINPELVQELLQYSGKVEVMSPVSLCEEIKKRLRKALEVNEL